ncbi:Sugar phosphate isomerase/epimerase [Candidatus Methanophagaceae archaeon]|nr:Sugar phosphate isomerase/epimerase [Methanophagales archaeon]
MEGEKMKVGVNSWLVKEISGGPLSLSYLNVELVELGFDDVTLLDRNREINHAMLWALDSFDVTFSLHVPTSDAREPNLRVDLGRMLRHNFRIMERVFEIASLMDIRRVVIHGGDILAEHGDKFAGIAYRKAFLNTVRNLKTLASLARDYSVVLYLENLDDNRVGSLPVELLALLHAANTDIYVTLDTGHAFIIAERYGIPLSDFFDVLNPVIKHVHLHDNDGISDLHLPPGEGKIDVGCVLMDIWDAQPENVVLEINRFVDPENVKESIKAVKGDPRLLEVYNQHECEIINSR